MQTKRIIIVSLICCFSLAEAASAKTNDSGQWFKSPLAKIKSPLEKFKYFPLDRLYAGGAMGQSAIEPEYTFLFSEADNADLAAKFWLSYHASDELSAEFTYANLGAAEFQSSTEAVNVGATQNEFGSEVKYQTYSLAALYTRALPLPKLSAFGRGGLSYLDAKSDAIVAIKEPMSLSIGLGLKYQISSSFIGRVEYESFSKDSKLFSIGVAKRLGKPRPKAIMPERMALTPKAIIEDPAVEADPETQPEAEEPVEEAGLEEPKQEDVAIVEEEEVEEALNIKTLAELKHDMEPYLKFEKGSAILSESASSSFDELVYFLLEHPEVQMVITGHACDVGHEYLNENLSKLRSHGAKSYLQASGIEPERIIVKGRGEDYPLYENISEEERALNRRLEVDFYIKQGS